MHFYWGSKYVSFSVALNHLLSLYPGIPHLCRLNQIEEQDWPVTPYQIKVYTQAHCPDSWYYVYVDGVESEWEVVRGGTEWLVRNVHLS